MKSKSENSSSTRAQEEFIKVCGKVGKQAVANGLNEEKLNQILSREPMINTSGNKVEK